MRRPRYPGKNPRAFHLKYKELQPERYGQDVAKIVAAGKTPAGTHRPIMVDEILRVLAPRPGDIAVDCTLGFGGHARAVLERVIPGGRLVGVDVDPIELLRTEARLRAAGFGEDVFIARRTNFAGLAAVLAHVDVDGADVLLADLGVSSMQIDNPERGFTFKSEAPLDMRMNPTRGEPAAALLARLDAPSLATLLVEHADEPHAEAIARRVAGQELVTTRALADEVRQAVIEARPHAWEQAADASVRRVVQTLRIAVNDELSALDALLRTLPACVRPGGRVAILTFHSGEDRRVKKAFQAGRRAGLYRPGADEVIRASAAEVRANPRASSAKLRSVVRASRIFQS